MSKHNPDRRAVSPAEVLAVVEAVAKDYGLPTATLRSGRKGGMITVARHEAWRRLAGPGVSRASIARLWPCHHTALSLALGPAR